MRVANGLGMYCKNSYRTTSQASVRQSSVPRAPAQPGKPHWTTSLLQSTLVVGVKLLREQDDYLLSTVFFSGQNHKLYLFSLFFESIIIIAITLVEQYIIYIYIYQSYAYSTLVILLCIVHKIILCTSSCVVNYELVLYNRSSYYVPSYSFTEWCSNWRQPE